MSAVSLARWVHDEAEAAIGGDGQKWVQLFDTAIRQALQLEIDSESRMAFRNAGLEAIALARKLGALPAYYCKWRELRLRTGFMQRGDWGAEWLREEAEKVLSVFLDAVPADVEFIENTSTGRSRMDGEYREAFFGIGRLSRYLRVARPFLSESSRQVADQWLAQVDRLP
jgi:hypothetical protein